MEQRLSVGNRRIRDELDKLRVMSFIDNNRVSRFYRCEVFLVFFDEACHVFFVGLNNFLGVITTVQFLHYGFNVLDVSKKNFMFLAAEQISAVS